MSTLTLEDLVSNGQLVSLETAILLKLDLDVISDQLARILGVERVQELYRDVEPRSASAGFHLSMPLARSIPACCSPSTDRRISLDSDQLYNYLSQLADCVEASEVSYNTCLRVTNIDISEEFGWEDMLWQERARALSG